jgi:hypothetical protein
VNMDAIYLVMGLVAGAAIAAAIGARSRIQLKARLKESQATVELLSAVLHKFTGKDHPSTLLVPSRAPAIPRTRMPAGVVLPFRSKSLLH